MTNEERIKKCQTEINRLRSVIRTNREALQYASVLDYQRLFEIWADFDNAEAPDKVIELVETSGLGLVDAVSFIAFCYGYYRAIQRIKDTA